MTKAFLTLVFCLVALTSFGQKDSTTTLLTLNGHTFVINPFINDPFIYTSFGLHMGYGNSSGYDLPPIMVGEYELNLKGGSNLYANLHANYSQKINDWAAVYIGFGVSGRLGTEPSSIITQGLNSVSGLNYGMKFKIWNNHRSQLTGEFQIKNYAISYINVLDYLRDLVQNNPNADLTKNINSLFGNVGIQYAYAINDLLGVYGTARYTFGDSVVPGKTVDTMNYGISFDINLNARTEVPIAASIGFTSATLPEFTLERSTTSTIFALRIIYSGREDLQVGISYSYFEAPIEIENQAVPTNINSNVSDFALVFRYFFN